MKEDTNKGKTYYCTHTNNNESGICDKCLGKEDAKCECGCHTSDTSSELMKIEGCDICYTLYSHPKFIPQTSLDTKCCEKCLKCPDYQKHNYCHISDCPCHTDKSDTNTLREEGLETFISFFSGLNIEDESKAIELYEKYVLKWHNQKLEEIEEEIKLILLANSDIAEYTDAKAVEDLGKLYNKIIKNKKN